MADDQKGTFRELIEPFVDFRHREQPGFRGVTRLPFVYLAHINEVLPRCHTRNSSVDINVGWHAFTATHDQRTAPVVTRADEVVFRLSSFFTIVSPERSWA